MHNSGSIAIFATGWLATRLTPPKSRDSNISVSTCLLYFTLGRVIILDIVKERLAAGNMPQSVYMVLTSACVASSYCKEVLECAVIMNYA